MILYMVQGIRGPSSAPHLSMSHPYALRVTLSNDAIDSTVLAWIKAESPSHLVIKHSKDKDVTSDHWHALLWSPRKLQALRHALKKANPDIVNNGMYSLKECKPGEEGTYERYMCHADVDGGRVHIVSANGLKYTQAWAQEQNHLYYSVQREFVVAKKTGKDASSFHERFIVECEAQGLMDLRRIIALYCEMCLESKRPMNEYHMQASVNCRIFVIDRSTQVERYSRYFV